MRARRELRTGRLHPLLWLAGVAAFAGVALSGAAPASAATTIGSTTYASDYTWTVAGSPYVVTGTVGVAAAATLTIEPGVVVKFSGTDAGMSVAGRLSAVGTATSPIVFTSYADDTAAGDTNGDGSATTGAAGQWYSLGFTGSASGALTFAQVRYGGYGSSNLAYAAVSIGGNSSVLLDHSSVTASQTSGIYVSGGVADVAASTISSNGIGVLVANATVHVTGRSSISNNADKGIYLVLTNASTPPPTSTVMDSDIAHNGGLGIYVNVNNYPLGALPHGSRNNVYANGDPQLGFPFNSGLRESDLDWNNNYWGDTYQWFEPADCRLSSPPTHSRLIWAGGSGWNPAGPVSDNLYFNGSSVCSARATST